MAIEEDSGTQTIQLSGIGPGGGEIQAISISASSNNPSLIPTPLVSYVTPNSTGGLNYTPVADLSGSAEITVTVIDAGLDGDLNSIQDNQSITRTFTVTIDATGDAPTLDAIGDPVAIDEDSGTQTIQLLGIGPGGGEIQAISISASSSNPSLISTPSVSYISPNSTGSLSYTSEDNLSGRAEITVTVIDAGLDGDLNTSLDNQTVIQRFTVTINPVNDPPLLDFINDPEPIAEDAGSQTIGLSGIGSGGGETQALAVSAISSDTSLIAHPKVIYTSTDPTGTLSYAPLANQHGSSVITVTITDAGLDGDLNLNQDNGTVIRSFTVVVGSGNDPPTISPISDQNIDEDNSGLTLAFTVGDIETSPEQLVVSGSSSNTDLVANSAIVPGGTGGNRTVTITPVANASGTTTITLSVRDSDNGTAAKTFLFTVNPVNDPPTLDAISNPVAVDEDAAVQTIVLSGISGGGGETQTISISASSDNPNLIPTPSVSYISPNSTGSLSYTSVVDQSGSAEITVIVIDAGLDGDLNTTLDNQTVTRTFTVMITATGDAPTLDEISDPEPFAEDAGPQTIGLSGIGAGGGEIQTLKVSAISSNSSLIPTPSVNYISPNSTGSLSYTPVVDQSGSAEIAVTVTDAGLDGDLTTDADNQTFIQTFTVTITATGDAPTLDEIGDPVAIGEDSGTQTIGLSGISAGGGELQAISISANSDNPTLIPTPSISYISPNSIGSLSYISTKDQAGSAEISVTITDAGLDGDLNTSLDNQTVTRRFTVTVNPVNDPPLLDLINDPEPIAEDSMSQTFSLSGIGAGGGEIQTLAVSAISSDTGLIAHPTVIYSSPNTTGTLSYAPLANQNGSAVITVTVTDAGLDGDLNSTEDNGTVIRSFTVVVGAGNDLPTISPINDQNIDEDNSGLTIAFTVGDIETSLELLVVEGSSSNTELVANSAIITGGTGGSRTVSITPEANASGTTTILLSVRDLNNGTITETFDITVNPVNDPPTLDPISNPVAVDEDADVQTIGLSGISSGSGETQTISIRASSDNPSLIPTPSVSFVTPNSTGSLTYTPAVDASGTAVVTVTVTDAGLDGNLITDVDNQSITQTFSVTVNPVNDLPTIDSIPDSPAVFDTSNPVTISIMGISAGGNENQALNVTAISSNSSTIPDPLINYQSPESVGSLTYSPQVGHTGTSEITVTVTDGGFDNNISTPEDNRETSQTFLVTIDPLPIGDLSISGIVSYFSAPNQGVPNVQLSLSGDLTSDANTDASGVYEFAGLGAKARVSVLPFLKSEQRAWHGLTTIDIALIRRHILGIKRFDSPYQILAADVNGSRSVTMLDVSLIWREILALSDSFPVGNWKFLPTNFQFSDPEQPWDTPASREYAGIAPDLTNQDFIAIKLGDVNGSWGPRVETAQTLSVNLGLKRADEPKRFSSIPEVSQSAHSTVSRRSLNAGPPPSVFFDVSKARPVREAGNNVDSQNAAEGEIARPSKSNNSFGKQEKNSAVPATNSQVYFPVRVSNFKDVTGVQFTLEWDPTLLRFIAVKDFNLPDLRNGNYGMQQSSLGRVTFVWYDRSSSGVSLVDGSNIFRVQFEDLSQNLHSSHPVHITDTSVAREVSVRLSPANFRRIEQVRPQRKRLE